MFLYLVLYLFIFVAKFYRKAKLEFDTVSALFTVKNVMHKKYITNVIRDHVEATNRVGRMISVLSDLPEVVDIELVDNNSIWIVDHTYAVNMEILHEIRSVGFTAELSSYHLSGSPSEKLVLCYRLSKEEWNGEYITVYVYCIDVENALERVGNGKCEIQEVEIAASTARKVVCNL